MIERTFVKQKKKEFQILEFVSTKLGNVGLSNVKMQRTPLGEKIVVYASRPGLVVGREGANIKSLTQALKKKFALENPQIEISEVENINLDAEIVAERITSALERFGSSRFKAIGHKALTDVMNAGAKGVEIKISGKIPGARAKKWRFYAGYLKKCGDIALTIVNVAYKTAKLKSGVVGVQVRIMPSDIKLPDDISLVEEEEKPKEPEKKPEEKPEEKKQEKVEKKKEELKPKEKKQEKVETKEKAPKQKVKNENKRTKITK